jgi:hypothetical protein
MDIVIPLHGRALRVRLTSAAQVAFEQREAPLLAEIHLIFGCMVAKRVWFNEEQVQDAVLVTEHLQVCFRSVRYAKTCSFREIDEGAEYDEFPMVADKGRFVPDWLEIDFRKGKWSGTFGYDRAIAQENHQQDFNELLVTSY